MKKNGFPYEKPRSVCIFEKPSSNLHMHWMIYIPFELVDAFKNKLSKWLQRYQGFVYDNSIDVQDINPYTLKTISNYMAKGIDPNWATFFHLQDRVSFQGCIEGQRCKVARCLGRTALKRSGFEARTQRNDWVKLYPELSARYPKPANWTAEEVIPQVLTVRTFPSMKLWLKRLWKKKRRWYWGSTSISTGSNQLNNLIAKQLGYSIGSIENRDR